MATAAVDLVNIFGSPLPEPFYDLNQTAVFGDDIDHDLMTFRIDVHTRVRNLFRHNNGEIQVVDQFRPVGWPETCTIRVPETYLAQPTLLEQLLFRGLSPINLDQIVPQLLSFAVERPGFRHIEAVVDAFTDRFLTEEQFIDRALFQFMDLDLEEEERRQVIDPALQKLRNKFGVDCDASNQGGEVGTCSVCLEDLCGKLIRLHCSHLYHESCILRWLERKNSCPMCRRQLSVD